MFLTILALGLGATQTASTACDPQVWELQGLPAQVTANSDASFSEAWRDQLTAIAACLSKPAHLQSCLEVQGRYDERNFPPAIISAFGSEQAAQEARASARAGRVLVALHRAGAPSERLIEAPPPDEATFRGVVIRIVDNCRLDTNAILDRAERAAAQALAAARAFEDHNEPQAPSLPAQVVLPVPDQPGPFFLEARGEVALAVLSPVTAFGPAVRLGGGVRIDRFVVSGGAGFGVSTASGQRTSLEFSGAAGYQLWSSIDAEIVGGYRVGAPDPLRPWIEQSWFLGLGATECPWQLGPNVSLCVHQAIYPFGERLRRGEVAEDGTLFRIPEDSNSQWRFDLAASLRAAL